MATLQSSRQHSFHLDAKICLAHHGWATFAKETDHFLLIQGKFHEKLHVYFRLTLKCDDGLTENYYDILWI